MRNHIRSKRDARTANRRAAVVLLLLYVYRYESYIARRVVFRPRRTRTHLGRTTRARTRTRLGATFPPNVVVPVVPATSKKSAFGRDGGALPRALGRERRARGHELGSAPLFRRTSLYQSFPRRRRNLRLAATAEHSRARSDANDASRSRCRRDATTVPGTTWRRLSPSRALSSSWRCTRSPSPTRCVRRNPRALVPPHPSRSTS